jgi:hypothetical protein
MSIPDSTAATVEVVYSNIGEEWCASLVDEDGSTLAHAKADSRADALRGLADEIE